MPTPTYAALLPETGYHWGVEPSSGPTAVTFSFMAADPQIYADFRPSPRASGPPPGRRWPSGRRSPTSPSPRSRATARSGSPWETWTATPSA